MPINSTSLYSIPVNRSEPAAVKKSSARSVAPDPTPVAEPRQDLPVVGNNVSPLVQSNALQGSVTDKAAGHDKQQASDAESISKAISDINENVQVQNRNLEFTVDKELGETIIKVVDRETQEVVRQIPTEEVVHLARHLKELQDDSAGGFLIEVTA